MMEFPSFNSIKITDLLTKLQKRTRKKVATMIFRWSFSISVMTTYFLAWLSNFNQAIGQVTVMGPLGMQYQKLKLRFAVIQQHFFQIFDLKLV